MPKSTNYNQKFRHSWLKDNCLKDWIELVQSADTTDIAKCKLCGVHLRSHYGDLKAHASTRKHLQNVKVITIQPKLTFKQSPEAERKKVAEIRSSLFTAMHTSIRSVDHMVEVMNYNKDFNHMIHLHRTKCSYIIKNALAPHFVEILKKDLSGKLYSLLLDESTDIAVHKYLGIIVIFYSGIHKRIVSTFLDLPELTECNADGIVTALKKTLKKFDMNIANLMGIGTDNASVMTGINNGVYAKLKQEVPNLILVRCLCHSLQLAVSAAAKQFLPRNLEFLIRETYDWFSRSSTRQSSYKALYRAINDGNDPLKIVQACQTRWLSIESAVSRIYTQWLELKTHFGIAKVNERSYTAETLHGLFSNDINYAYIAFLVPILSETNRVNKLFQSKNADHTKLYDELMNLITMLVNKITLAANKVNVFVQNIRDFVDPKCYLGYRFETQISTMKEKGLTRGVEEEVRNRCIEFIINLIMEIKNRLPENVALMKNICRVSVDNALSHNKNSIAELMMILNKKHELIAKVDDQWRQIHLLKWNETKNTVKFWNEVCQFKDSRGENRFQELATFATSLLILPHSNADVERLFSSMNIVKSKQRNRMKLQLLTSILTIRWGLILQGKCCFNFEIPSGIINQIGTKEVYASEVDATSSHSEEEG